MNAQAVSWVDNHAIRNGGAVYLAESLASGRVGLQDVNCSENTAKRGGCIFMSNIASLGILNSQDSGNLFRGNKAGAGGALYLLPSSQINNNIRIATSEFSENEALLDYKEAQPEFNIPGHVKDIRKEAEGLQGYKTTSSTCIMHIHKTDLIGSVFDRTTTMA